MQLPGYTFLLQTVLGKIVNEALFFYRYESDMLEAQNTIGVEI